MLAYVSQSKPYVRHNAIMKTTSSHALPGQIRTRAIILVLLDTGMRASELCGLRITDLDIKQQRVQVFGKGSKERMLPFSSRTGQSIWRYLATRETPRDTDPLFATVTNHHMRRWQLNKSLHALGDRAGISDVHPHRFRHTFAIQYLRNGGDPYTLQAILGHSTLDMVRRYLALAEVDVQNAHRRASPVDNWSL